MMRLHPDDVVSAFERTKRIPIRLAWTTQDHRGGCAIDTVALVRGISADALRQELNIDYETGFLHAWDADSLSDPELLAEIKERSPTIQLGFLDGVACRGAVERVFSSKLLVIEDSADTPVEDV